MNYFFYNKIKININLLIQTAPSNRQFMLSGCVNDLTKSNYKFNYYTYIFKYLDKVKFEPDHKEIFEFFGFSFENEKLISKINHAQIIKMLK
jgi:hypothetical protein